MWEAKQRLGGQAARNCALLQPLHDFTKVLWDTADLTPDEVASIPRHPVPPWELSRPTFDLSLSDVGKKNDCPHLLRCLALDKISGLKDTHVAVYTDGSVGSDGAVGSSFVIPVLGTTGKFKLNVGVSVFAAELFTSTC